MDEDVKVQNALAQKGAAFAAMQSGFSLQSMVPRRPLHEVLAHKHINMDFGVVRVGYGRVSPHHIQRCERRKDFDVKQ